MKGPRVSLEQWRVLQAVVDCGGYAQAAEYLHRSQSSVSYTVARLQEQLGIRLLQIEGRKAGLTEAGEALLRRSRHLLDAALDLEQFADSLEPPDYATHLRLARHYMGVAGAAEDQYIEGSDRAVANNGDYYD